MHCKALLASIKLLTTKCKVRIIHVSVINCLNQKKCCITLITTVPANCAVKF